MVRLFLFWLGWFGFAASANSTFATFVAVLTGVAVFAGGAVLIAFALVGCGWCGDKDGGE